MHHIKSAHRAVQPDALGLLADCHLSMDGFDAAESVMYVSPRILVNGLTFTSAAAFRRRKAEGLSHD